MIDFPASPTLGQQFTAAGVTWVWDGIKWTASGLSVAYLPLSGGTLSGPLTVQPAAGGAASALVLNPLTNNWSYIDGERGSLGRWRLWLPTNAAETGGNAGSNLQLDRYNDAGAMIDSPLAINRATGIVTIPNLSAPGVIGDNRIINGDMRIDQRNNGAAGTTTGVYTVDRWAYGSNQANKGQWGRFSSVAGGMAGGGFSSYLSFVSSSAYASLAGDSFFLQQPIEADMVSDLFFGSANAQPVTLSFWALSNQAGTFSGTVFNYPAPATRSYPFTFSLPTANTWTKIVVTIPGDTAGTWVVSGNAAGMGVRFDLGSGASMRGPANAWASANYVGATGAVSTVATNVATFYFTGVKLEIGSVATPFNRQSLAKSLADCQRYYEVGQIAFQGYAVAGSVCYAGQPFQVMKRANPTKTVTANNSGNVGALTFASLQGGAAFPACYGLTIQATVAATSGYSINANFTMDAEL